MTIEDPTPEETDAYVEMTEAAAIESAGEHHLDDNGYLDGFADGADWAAGWAFAIVGMAQAIRNKHREACHWDGHPWLDARRTPKADR